jgi:hypothetical protein
MQRAVMPLWLGADFLVRPECGVCGMLSALVCPNSFHGS